MTKSKTKASRPTVQDVANLAGVSASTVSLVLQGKGSLPEDTRAKVKKAVEQAGYTPLRVRRGKSDYPVVAVIADDAENPYYAELCLAIEDALENRNCLLVFASSRGSEERQVQLLKTFAEMGCLGVFLIPANGSDQPTLNAIRNSTIPIVLGVRHLGFGSIDYVGPNYFLGMQLATRHLLDLGHKNIALVGGFPENTAYAERLGGFRMSISSDGDPAIQTTEMVGPATAEFGMAAIDQLLAMRSPPTAIIGYNDRLCFGLLAGARDAGLTPGQDIAIVGFDDVHASAQQSVPLTTVSTPPARIGAEMARLLEARLANPSAQAVHIIPPPVLKIRKSCGDLRGADPVFVAEQNKIYVGQRN